MFLIAGLKVLAGIVALSGLMVLIIAIHELGELIKDNTIKKGDKK